ncbi:OmpH family outer membrane protein [Rhizobium sp. CRIBSB]|nr:OmpH family outer membrane protein [Rhizobium sp. CRIBSB]
MKLFASAAFVAASLVATGVSAQSQTAPVNPGPVIPGICVINLEGALAVSTAGQAISTRMRQLNQDVAGEINPYYESVQTGLTSLQQSAAAMTQEQREQQAQLLRQRYEEAQQLDKTRQEELSYTAQQQLGVLAAAARPIIAAVYAERGCGILMSSDTVIEMNPAMDISQTVVDRLNAQVAPNGNFNRMPVPVQAQQPAARQ